MRSIILSFEAANNAPENTSRNAATSPYFKKADPDC